jgi:nitrogen-specific signal transduction histidine kinase
VIADEGMGIPDDLLPKLFEPLKQHVCQNIWSKI